MADIETLDALTVLADQLDRLDCRMGSVQDHLLLVAAIELAKNGKAIGGRTVSITVPNPALLYQNDTQGPVFVHVRAKLPAGAGQPRLYVGPSEAAVFNADAAPYSLFTDDIDTFLVQPGEALYGHITGPADGTAASIPVGLSQVLDAFRALRRMTGTGG